MPDCEPVEVMEDGWSEWMHPSNGFLFQCCDCGLIHELEFTLGSSPSGDNLLLFRAKRIDQLIVEKT